MVVKRRSWHAGRQLEDMAKQQQLKLHLAKCNTIFDFKRRSTLVWRTDPISKWKRK